MSKYQLFPMEKPEVNQLIWYVGPIAKEILGYYCGGTDFVEADGTKKGFFVLYWRAANEADALLPTWSPLTESVLEKRKYTPRKPKDE